MQFSDRSWNLLSAGPLNELMDLQLTVAAIEHLVYPVGVRLGERFSSRESNQIVPTVHPVVRDRLEALDTQIERLKTASLFWMRTLSHPHVEQELRRSRALVVFCAKLNGLLAELRAHSEMWWATLKDDCPDPEVRFLDVARQLQDVARELRNLKSAIQAETEPLKGGDLYLRVAILVAAGPQAAIFESKLRHRARDILGWLQTLAPRSGGELYGVQLPPGGAFVTMELTATMPMQATPRALVRRLVGAIAGAYASAYPKMGPAIRGVAGEFWWLWPYGAEEPNLLSLFARKGLGDEPSDLESLVLDIVGRQVTVAVDPWPALSRVGDWNDEPADRKTVKKTPD